MFLIINEEQGFSLDPVSNPEKTLAFLTVKKTIDDFLSGSLDTEEIVFFDKDAHERAKEFIFGDQSIDYSFEFCWQCIYPDWDISLIRTRLAFLFQKRYKRYLRKRRKNVRTQIEVFRQRSRNPKRSSIGRDTIDSPEVDECDQSEAILFGDGL